MTAAIAILLAIVINGQVVLKDIYTVMDVSNGVIPPDQNFLSTVQRGLRGFGTFMILSYIGIWTIKLNFLLFFKRLGAQFTGYMILWWAVTIITIACFAAVFGTLQFDCMFGSAAYIMTVCPSQATLKKTYTIHKVSCALDAISDFLSKF